MPLAFLLPVWRWLKANPLLLALALCACWGLYQRHQANKWHNRAVACETASKTAAAAQKALREGEAQTYKEKAREADSRYAADLDRARDTTRTYIAAHRVQPARHLSPAQPIGQAGDAGQPQDLSQPAVVVAEPDVQAAAEWQAFGVTCHDFLLSITEPAK